MVRKDRTVRTGTARARAWAAMRVLRHFSLSDVIEISGISECNAKQYITFLTKTGYLKRTRAGLFLAKDTGLKTPVFVNDAFKYKAYDPNLEAYFEVEKPKRSVCKKLSKRAIGVLKKSVNENGREVVAKSLGCSKASISLLLRNKYPANAKEMEKKITLRLRTSTKLSNRSATLNGEHSRTKKEMR